jgi:acetyl-CoA C-acetyltransferase
MAWQTGNGVRGAIMRTVYLLGAAATPVAEHWNRTAISLGREALQKALGAIDPSRVGALYVANALSAAIGGQAQLGAGIAAASGLLGVEAHVIEASGASGGVALRQATLAIAAGACDLAVVVGVEKTTDVLDGKREAAQALASDVDWEAIHGTTTTAQWAMLMRRYMHQYDVDADAFAAFPVNAHANGVANKGAMYRFAISADKVRSAAPVAEPLTLLDCSTSADGAAAVVLASEGLARELGGTPLRIAGSAVATDALALHSRRDPLWFEAASRSTTVALRSARLSVNDVHVLDFTDPHGIAAVIALESSGFAERGMATHLAREGAIRPTGAIPIATGGGCKARGDLIGANGVYQIVELARQLRGEAGAAQVANARVALAQSVGGIGTTVATHLLVAE